MTLVRVLTGPTASGKSTVALHLAGQLGAEVLSLDSMKLYRGLDVGTAKPDAAARAAVQHHLVDIKDPWESASVAEILRAAEGAIAACAQRGVPLITEGGTALYLKALAEGLFAGPGRDDALRAELEAEAAAKGVALLYERLRQIDAPAAAKILPGDKRRIIRALEVHALTNVPISRWQTQWGAARSDLDVRIVCLQLPRARLYARIDQRVDAMLAAGWLDECRRLLTLEKPLSREASQALGYRTLFAHLHGEMTLAAARERICFDTHHFARRQLNWFKHLPKTKMLEIHGDEAPAEIARRVLAAWEE